MSACTFFGHREHVVTYITHSWGGAAQFAERGKRHGKHIINLAQIHA